MPVASLSAIPSGRQLTLTDSTGPVSIGSTRRFTQYSKHALSNTNRLLRPHECSIRGHNSWNHVLTKIDTNMSMTLTETRPQSIELKSLSPAHTQPEASRVATLRDDASDDYPKGIRLFCVTAALILSILLSTLDATVISTLIPEITNAFGSLNQVGWYGSAYAMTNAAFLSLWGKAYTHFDFKRTFMFCAFVFEFGNLLCGFATGSPMLIVGRIIAGTGGSGSMTGCFIIIAYAVKPERRAIYMATLGVTFAVASVTGPLLGGAFVDKLSWRWGFW